MGVTPGPSLAACSLQPQIRGLLFLVAPTGRTAAQVFKALSGEHMRRNSTLSSSVPQHNYYSNKPLPGRFNSLTARSKNTVHSAAQCTASARPCPRPPLAPCLAPARAAVVCVEQDCHSLSTSTLKHGAFKEHVKARTAECACVLVYSNRS